MLYNAFTHNVPYSGNANSATIFSHSFSGNALFWPGVVVDPDSIPGTLGGFMRNYIQVAALKNSVL